MTVQTEKISTFTGKNASLRFWYMQALRLMMTMLSMGGMLPHTRGGPPWITARPTLFRCLGQHLSAIMSEAALQNGSGSNSKSMLIINQPNISQCQHVSSGGI